MSLAAGADGQTFTFPGTSDTIVGRASSDNLTNKTLNSSTDVLGGVTVTLGSDAQGDLYYRNAGGQLTRLGVGGTGQLLGSNGTVPGWVSTSSVNFWQQNQGVLSPLNITDDLAIGGTATAGAKFQVVSASGNVTAGTYNKLAITAPAAGAAPHAAMLNATINNHAHINQRFMNLLVFSAG